MSEILRAQRGRNRPRSSQEWVEYFRSNAALLVAIPWECGGAIDDAQRQAIATSIAEFQLGESSEGKHFKGFARAYAQRTGDFSYVPALSAFIAEENRHARDLGRFMDLAGIPRASCSWPDGVFRWLRKRAGLELSITVLVTAEIIAQVYYAALREATDSPVLRRLCDQILADEVKHVQFQSERLAILRRRRRPWVVSLQQSAHRLFLAGTILVVWRQHGRALRAGNWSFARFWRDVWEYMKIAIELADPRSYAFEQAGPIPACLPAGSAESPSIERASPDPWAGGCAPSP
jgi:hypothetical protein